jgi:chromosome partitioning protein
MRSIAFVTQKGGAGKTTLAASLAEMAASAGERVIALDLDQQQSLTAWGRRREARAARNKVVVEPLESERIPRLKAILDGLAGADFTLAIFDTTCADARAVRLICEVADLCLLPARPTRLDVEATAETFRAVFLAKRKAAFVLNQCPSSYRSTRAIEAAKRLTALGVLAEPLLSARIDFQDAIAAGLGVTEYASGSKAAEEIATLWAWSRGQLPESRNVAGADRRSNRQAAA